jgi:hypothetical protein
MSSASELGNLRRELVARLGRAAAHPLPRGQELDASALGERLHADPHEQVVCGAQRRACIDTPVLAAQPLPVELAGRGLLAADRRQGDRGVRPMRVPVASLTASTSAIISAALIGPDGDPEALARALEQQRIADGLGRATSSRRRTGSGRVSSRRMKLFSILLERSGAPFQARLRVLVARPGPAVVT